MRLLAVSTWCPCPPNNGSRMRAYHLLEQLSTRHEITLVSFVDDVTTAPDVARQLRSIAAHVELVPGDPFVRGPLSVRGLLSRTPRSLVQASNPRMRRVVDHLLPLHDAALGLQVNAALYVNAGRTPRVFEEAEVGALKQGPATATGLTRVRRELTWRKTSAFMKRLVTEFDRTTVVSSVERTHLLELGAPASRVVVVPNGADVTDLTRARPTPVRRLLYPGALTYSANLDAVRWFLDAIWPRLRQSQPELTFLVTGTHDGIDLNALPNLEGVTFTGRVDDIKTLVAESALVVVPLRLGGGTRLKVLEAMALGTPVVSTSKGVEGLDVLHGQHVLIADHPHEFAGEVVRVLDAPALAVGLSQRGRDLVRQQYSWARSAAILDDALAGARAESVGRPTA